MIGTASHAASEIQPLSDQPGSQRTDCDAGIELEQSLPDGSNASQDPALDAHLTSEKPASPVSASFRTTAVMTCGATDVMSGDISANKQDAVGACAVARQPVECAHTKEHEVPASTGVPKATSETHNKSDVALDSLGSQDSLITVSTDLPAHIRLQAGATSASCPRTLSMKRSHSSLTDGDDSFRQSMSSGRGLRPQGTKIVAGFELQGLHVAKCSKKLPKTQSWCFVPLIFSALGKVPARLWREGISTKEQIASAQPVWSDLFSHWTAWRSELRKAIDSLGEDRFEREFLPGSHRGGGSGWTTSLVYGEPRIYGRLPHPAGPRQDATLALLPCDIQNQIFASVIAIASN